MQEADAWQRPLWSRLAEGLVHEHSIPAPIGAGIVHPRQRGCPSRVDKMAPAAALHINIMMCII